MADPIKVSVTQAVSVDVPLPYSMVRGEQIELRGSVYNQAEDNIKVKPVKEVLLKCIENNNKKIPGIIYVIRIENIYHIMHILMIL